MVVRKKKSMDANNAAAWVSYAFTEVAGIWCRKLKTASGIFYTEICNRNCYLQAGCIILTDQIKKDQIKKDIRKPGSSFVVI